MPVNRGVLAHCENSRGGVQVSTGGDGEQSHEPAGSWLMQFNRAADLVRIQSRR